MMDCSNKIEKVHGIDIKRLSQIGCRIDRFQINFGSDVSKLLPHDRVNVDSRS